MILRGNSLDVLKAIKSESMDCCITSPPYWGLRAYGTDPQVWDDPGDCEHNWMDTTYVRNNDQTAGEKQRTNIGAIGRDEPVKNGYCQNCGAWRGEYGLEPTPELYIKHSVAIFGEVKRVLKKEGTLWLNIGDSYASGKGTCYNPGGGCSSLGKDRKELGAHPLDRGNKSTLEAVGLKPKDLVGIPWMLAFALRADGWYLRSDIIWSKPNPMPESVTDRPTKAHEYVFLMSKNGRYYYDAEAVKEPSQSDHDSGNGFTGRQGGAEYQAVSGGTGTKEQWKCGKNPATPPSWKGSMFHDGKNLINHPNVGKNRLKVPGGWDTKEGAHGTIHREGRSEPEYNYQHKRDPEGLRVHGNIPGRDDNGHACNKPDQAYRNLRTVWTIATAPFSEAHFATFPPALAERCIKAGCPEGGIVLDPFFGAGTVGLVAKKLNRRYVGIELKPEYCEMAERRINRECGTLF